MGNADGQWGTQREVLGQDSFLLVQSGSKVLMISCGYSMPWCLKECRMDFVSLTTVKSESGLK